MDNLGPPRDHQRDPLRDGDGLPFFVAIFLLCVAALYWFLS